MIRIVENPYKSPFPQHAEGRRKHGAPFSSRAMRFATLGVLAGVGFGFVTLAMEARATFERRSLDDTNPMSGYVIPLLVFAFWSITAGASFGAVGAAIGFVADIGRPTSNECIDEPSGPPPIDSDGYDCRPVGKL